MVASTVAMVFFFEKKCSQHGSGWHAEEGQASMCWVATGASEAGDKETQRGHS